MFKIYIVEPQKKMVMGSDKYTGFRYMVQKNKITLQQYAHANIEEKRVERKENGIYIYYESEFGRVKGYVPF